MKINLGSGKMQIDGYVNVDKRKCVKPDILMDFEKEEDWIKCFGDDTIDEVFASHIMEHIRDFNMVMKQLYRICKAGAKITVISPYWRHHIAFDDPDHCRCITEKTFIYYNKGLEGSDGSNIEEILGFVVDFRILGYHYNNDKEGNRKEIIIVLEVKKCKE